MNIPDKAVLAMIEQLGLLPDEIEEAHVRALEAAAPTIIAQALRDMVDALWDGSGVLDRNEWDVRTQDANKLLDRADELDPQ